VSVAIRPITTHADYRQVEQLQRDVWSLPELEVVPLHVLITAAKNGGLLLGAFDGDRLAGFVFGFPGLTPQGALKHCSHMAGVHPAYRDRGLGYSLKLAQRDHVLAQGIDLITWTFDPLEARNATLNFHKLGAVCNTYLRNLYGEMRDGLNAGLPSDRFLVQWWIGPPPPSNSPLEGGRAGSSELSAVLTAHPVLSGPPPSEGGAGGGLIAVPTNFQALKTADITQARDLRLQTRALFEAAFAAGYWVTDFLVDREKGYYVLQSDRLDLSRKKGPI
jgi:predicted GNAT superfamily acetyltransferase